MEWEHKKNDVHLNDIPLQYAEKLSLYKSLGEYNKSDILLGMGIDAIDYLESAEYRKLTDENFQAITVGYHMKHGAVVTGSGAFNFATIDRLFAALPPSMEIYGHTLMWHNNQNAVYLKGLIAPTVVLPPAGSNLLPNGSFENDMDGWGQWGGGSSNEIVTENALDGDKMLKITVPNSGDPWSVQLRSPSFPAVVGNQYQISFWIRSEAPGEVRLSIGSPDMMSNRWPPHQDAAVGRPNGVIATTSAWQQITYSTNTITSADPWVALGTSVQFDLDLGQTDGVYYIDNVVVIDLDAASGTRSNPIFIEKTPTEKLTIIDNALKTWIFAMVEHVGDRVIGGWDVVNEPVNESGALRRGDGNGAATDTDAPDVFIWQDIYDVSGVSNRGDFAVKAFQYAREAGAKGPLFMNDYNLESAGGAKLTGFLDLVNYIESQGQTVDGLGTQMHVSIQWTTSGVEWSPVTGWATIERIDNMFQRMAATGKLVKVTELDVQVHTTSPSFEQQLRQADLYRYVIASYLKHVPTAQRAGITLWGIADGQEHWLGDDAPSLWTANLVRKPAYKGVADGLFGADASADWTYEDLVNFGAQGIRHKVNGTSSH
jgi:GH35 family endo-1,4-beta-xylanase